MSWWQVAALTVSVGFLVGASALAALVLWVAVTGARLRVHPAPRFDRQFAFFALLLDFLRSLPEK